MMGQHTDPEVDLDTLTARLGELADQFAGDYEIKLGDHERYVLVEQDRSGAYWLTSGETPEEPLRVAERDEEAGRGWTPLFVVDLVDGTRTPVEAVVTYALADTDPRQQVDREGPRCETYRPAT